MKNHFIFLTIFISCGISLSAQVAKKQADSIVKKYLQNEQIEYEHLYANINLPNENGISITTSNDEIFVTKYACWTYFVDENELSQRRYLFVKEEDGNILEVIASNDLGDGNSNQWEPVETTNVVENMKNNAEILCYPNPTTGQLTIDNGQLTIENIEIFDVYGRTVRAKNLLPAKYTVEIDISHFSAGVYWLKIKTETGFITQKVIKY